MREWWQNVYPEWVAGMPGLAAKWPTREGARSACGGLPLSCRIHVRLKPEGAPKRYATAWQRALWETDANAMRKLTEWGAERERMAKPYVND